VDAAVELADSAAVARDAADIRNWIQRQRQ
jgi:hypothetical protein